ncbi:protein kinase-like protein [Breznakibacter xylanolyticus]|uniref:Protein kinase-like protein n=1 Tax=Breznakibacter xylanolyticus TaxID=990 RepID=A0A2W7MZG8_9BACT|nr:serine/threonine-protein kinase [Breznakibacter xylanolyticus]PZX13535.1 protein kinase-like protein [Breznakibacter xylanolyticus]
MLTLKGATGTYQLEHKNGKPGKFGGILTGNRLEDHLLVTGKLIPSPQSTYDQERLERLLNLSHPNLADTIEIISHEEQHYLVRRYYAGENLKTILSKSKYHKHLSPHFRIKAAIALLDGLAHMHQQGLIHRDIKPANIIVRYQPGTSPDHWDPTEVLLTDFEQSLALPVKGRERSPFALVYSPPEQLLNHTHLTGPQSDIFALGVTLYEMFAGSAPWVDCNAEILLNLQLTYPMKRPSRIDESLFSIIARAAYKERFPLPPKRLAANVIEAILQQGIANRYPDAETMRNDLTNYLESHPMPIAGRYARIKKWLSC